jgi:pyrroloquinoline quinone biosynthesis protein D
MGDPDLNSRPALAPRVRLRDDPVTGEPVLLYPEGLLILNETAHGIASRCDGARSVAEIVAALAAEYETAEDDLRADVLECLRDLRLRNLIVFAE